MLGKGGRDVFGCSAAASADAVESPHDSSACETVAGLNFLDTAGVKRGKRGRTLALVCRSSSTPPPLLSSHYLLGSTLTQLGLDSSRFLVIGPREGGTSSPTPTALCSPPPELGLSPAALGLLGQLSTTSTASTTGSSFDSSLLFDLQLGLVSAKTTRLKFFPPPLTFLRSAV